MRGAPAEVQSRCAVVEERQVSLAELAARVMSLAQTGSADEARILANAGLEQVGADVAETPSSELACLWYAVAVTEHSAGDTAAQVNAADRCLSVASSLASPGWASNALSIRAMARVRQGAIDLALADLARAEVELADCGDDSLRCWAHTGLGYCYDQLRLYELAQPHFEAALAIESSPMPLPEAPVIDLRNLAELHLRWAQELERVVPLAASAQQVEEQMVRARRLAREALLAAQSLQLPSAILASQLLDLCARADVEPQAVLSGLAAALNVQESNRPSGERTEVATALARALRGLGRGPEAVAAARLAVESAVEPIDWQVMAGAHYLLVELEAEAGVPGAIEGRAYGRLLSNALWQQRLRTLQGARSALDVERLQRTTEIATRAAREDSLTGLGNRRALDEALVKLEASADEDQLAHSLVLIDVDGFKSVNDTYGHQVGDEVLKAVARTLRTCARRADLLIRLGGDEFVVLAAGATKLEAAALAARIHDSINNTDWGSIAHGMQVSISIGFAATGAGMLVADLFGTADAAMYADKRRHGRHQQIGAVSSL
jgi:diguanylate cyclase (GGDEF)-like protein